MRHTIVILIIASLVIILTPLVLYFSHFHGSLSTDIKEWDAFSDFLNPFATLLNTTILIYLTYLAYKLQGTLSDRALRNEEYREFRNTMLQLVLDLLKEVNNRVGEKTRLYAILTAVDFTLTGLLKHSSHLCW